MKKQEGKIPYTGPVLLGGLFFLPNNYVRPVVDVEITVGENHKKYIGWVDSGATHTVGSQKLINDLSLNDLPETDKGILENVNSATANGVKLPTYKVKIKVTGTDGIKIEDDIFLGILPDEIAHTDGSSRVCNIMIGIDILERGIFEYDNINNKYSLFFP